MSVSPTPPRPVHLRPALFFGLSFSMACACAAQDPLRLARLDGEIVLDGPSFEPAWERIAPLPLTMLYPTYGGELTERTEIRVAYDDAYLYAALRAYDHDPGGIRALTYLRDRWGEDDQFVLVLDTFQDGQNAMAFMVHPTGNRVDLLVFNDADPGRGSWQNQDWNTFWSAEAVVTDEGWFAELRIPFSSLQFRDEGGQVVMGLKAYRWLPRKFENQIFPATPPDAGAAPYFKPSLAHPVLLEGIEREIPLYVTPYVLSGVEQATDPTAEAGADLKYGLTSNLTLDLTLNTDFAQVEADEAEVNLTRFSLFFPEKRRFFQERSGIFDFNTGGRTRLFYSRRIGLDSAGRPVRILGGARVAGRAGLWDVGGMNLQTAHSDALPAENFGVVRLRRPLFGSGSYAGGLYTHRIGADGSTNFAYGLDGLLRLTPDDFLTVHWAQTFDELHPANLNAGRLRLHAERTRRQGFLYQADLIWSGPGYNPALGFVTARDFVQSEVELTHAWIPGEAARLQSHRLLVWNQTRVRNAGNITERSSWSLVWVYRFKNGWSGALWLNPTLEDLPESIFLSEETEIPVGRYRFASVNTTGSTPPGNLLRLDYELGAGTFYDGQRFTLNLSPAWNVSSRFELGLSYNLNDLSFPERSRHFTSHIARLRLLAALNIRLSAQAFLQYSSTDRSAFANVRLRYNIREGTDLWLVYNEASETRTVLVKYAHTFRL